MGMFDYLKSEYPLPLPPNQGELAGRNWRENDFQTKDFACLLEDYRIHEDGTLWRQTCTWETTRTGRASRRAAHWQPLDAHTGTARFYDAINGDKADYWVEWLAVFASGRLTELKLHCWEERDNRERLACEAKWKLERERCERFLATWVGRSVYPLCAWLIHGCLGMPAYRFCQWVGTLWDRAGYGLDRLAHRLAPYGDPIREKQRRRRVSSFLDRRKIEKE